MTADEIELELRRILADVLEQPEGDVANLPRETALLGSGLALDSLVGMQLLTAVEQRFGVDVAEEDLNLDSLETIGTLADFIAARYRASD